MSTRMVWTAWMESALWGACGRLSALATAVMTRKAHVAGRA